MNKPCACCTGITVVTPEQEYNRPGLPSIAYRAGSYATFFESMLARLSTVYVDVAPDAVNGAVSRLYPLKRLTTRQPSDPAIALLDAWAVVADVLTFYQERIANEGYLGTATERVSVLELARLIGYRPRPGVAASVFLAFTATNGFKGDIPAGTRAQSTPGAGETAQYFETAAKLFVRDDWNSLQPRLTRPQIVSPPAPPALQGSKGGKPVPFDNHLGTNADVIDSVYFQGIATNLKVNDALLLVLSRDPDQQFLRFVERVDPQADQSRTLVALRAKTPASHIVSTAVDDLLQRFANDAAAQFPRSDLAAGTASLLQGIVDKQAVGAAEAAAFARGVLPQVQAFHQIAVTRQFTRVEVWLQHLLDVLPGIIQSLETVAGRGGVVVQPRPSFAASSLEKLGALLPTLSLARSVPPVSPARLTQSVAVAFASHSDTMPRLIAALHPVAAPMVYAAWGGVQPVRVDLSIYAARVRATLFASSFAGFSQFDQAGQKTVFKAAKISNTWVDLIDPKTTTTLSVIALDTVYDKIAINSWIAISRPDLSLANPLAGRIVTYHQVLDIQTTSLDTTTGYTAKVSLLSLDSNWLSAGNVDEFIKLTDAVLLLRGTVVYAQAEPLDLAQEPLDRDVEGNSIELDGLFDGLEPGRWVVVSGERTDIPNVAGVQSSELAMISAVTQGAGKQFCVPFPPNFVSFESLFYISDENAAGDRLVVGVPAAGLLTLLEQLDEPTTLNQQFCEPVLLSPGIYANAYVPSANEKAGDFSRFGAQFIDPVTNQLFPGGIIPRSRSTAIFAWRIAGLASGSETVHTTIELASALSYKYNAAGISIYANVTKATHGQTTGEILGNGDASQAFQQFTLHQKPLTYLSAATREGAESTLAMTVNEIGWDETDDLAGLAPTDREYITTTDDADQTSVIFGNGVHGSRPPTGSANVKATYRYGIGTPGNVDAGQINQLAMHPLGLQGVVNPLPASGGADRDSLDQARRNAPLAVMALDRLVSIQDYADFARTYAGIGKASATLISDGRRQLVHLTIAGAGDNPIDQTSDLYQNFILSLETFGDPFQAVQVCIRKVKLLVISAGVQLQPAFDWETVEAQIRSAVLALYNFDARDLGQPAYLSEAIAAIQAVEGVLYVDMRIFDAVSEDTTVDELAKLAATLKLNSFVPAQFAVLDPLADPAGDPCRRIRAAELVFLTPDIPATLILTIIGG